MPMPPQLQAALNAKRGGSSIGKPSKPKKFGKPKKKKGNAPIGPSNDSILKLIGRAGGASSKVPPFMG